MLKWGPTSSANCSDIVFVPTETDFSLSSLTCDNIIILNTLNNEWMKQNTISHMRQIIEHKCAPKKYQDFMVLERIITTATMVENREVAT